MSSPRPGLSTEGPSAGGGFEYELREEDDPFSENYVPKRKELQGAFPSETRTGNKRSAGAAAGLGIDEEVEVTRKPRAPRVKLDEHR
jgi:replication fork protection complex subunit Csm3/Swi3